MSLPARTYPASSPQESLWYQDSASPDPSFCHLPFALRLRGPLREAALGEAFTRVLERFEILRTGFRWEGGALVQVVADPGPAELPIHDLAGLPPGEQQARRSAVLGDLARARFDLARGPLVRACLLRLGPEDHLLGFTCHHIGFDCWSLDPFLVAWRAHYRACCQGGEPALPPLASSFGDHARRQRERLGGEAMGGHLAYWQEHLAGAPARSTLPTDRPRPRIPGGRAGRVVVRLPPALTQGLKAFARSGKGTLFMALVAGFQLLLGRLSGQRDVVVGSRVAGRLQGDSWDQVGLFLNTLALRADLSGDPTVRDFFARVRQGSLAAFAHQELPYEELLKALGPARQAPGFQAVFVLQNAPKSGGTFLDLEERWEPLDLEVAGQDFALAMVEQETGLVGMLDYRAELFDRGTVERFGELYGQVLEAMVAGPDQPIGELLPAPEAERDRGRGPVVDLPREGVHRAFERQAALQPAAVALEAAGQSFTYGELDQLSAQVAAGLRQRGLAPGEAVGLYLDSGPEQVVGLLGILRAGAACAAGGTPAWARVRWALTREALVPALPPLEARVLSLDLDGLGRGRASAPGGDPGPVVSLGPSGAALTHGGLMNTLACLQDALGITPGDRVLAELSPQDALLGSLLALRAGARLLVTGPASDAREALVRRAPTVILGGLDTWRRLARSGWSGPARLLSTEDPGPLAPVLAARGRGAWYLRGWPGPDHLALLHRIGADGASPGRPAWNTRVQVLDPDLRPVPPGLAGDIFLGGDTPALAALAPNAFVPDPVVPGGRLFPTGARGCWRPGGLVPVEAEVPGARPAASPVPAVQSAVYEAATNPTEVILVHIWEDLLERRPIGIRDDFFDLGGHSLLVMRLAARIEEAFGRSLPLPALFESPTIASLGLALQADAAETPWVEGGRGPRRLFFLHGDFMGGGLFCRALARHLDGVCSLVAIHPYGLGGQPLARSIQTMAADHLALVRALQPRGPYLLGGYCNGALEALEMARLLADQGERADLVAMVAPPPPNAAPGDPDIYPRPPEAWEALELLHRRYCALVACFRQVATHVPEPYDGPVELFVPEGDLGPEGTLGWEGLLPRGRTHCLPGTHETSLARPELGEALARCLRGAGA